MIGFTSGDSWNPNNENYDKNGWFVYVYTGKLYGIGCAFSGTPYNTPIIEGDYITVIREGTSIRFEKNKIDLGICPRFTNIPNQPLFPAVDISEENTSVTLVNDYN